MAAGSTYTPIATTTLASDQSSYTFSSISGSYTDLVLIIGGTTAADGSFRIYFNSDTGSNYSWTQLYGSGVSAASNRGTSDTRISMGRSGSGQSNSIIQFQNYSNTTTNKTVIGRGNNPAAIVAATVGLWRSTAAISTIVISHEGGNLLTGMTLTLYGIAAA
jgi:hypothetical protein